MKPDTYFNLSLVLLVATAMFCGTFPIFVGMSVLTVTISTVILIVGMIGFTRLYNKSMEG